MKAFEWLKFLQQQRECYGKVIFTPTELANVAGHSEPTLKTALQRLTANGVLQRYAAGRYGLPGAVVIEDLVPSIDAGAYITGMYALHKHNLVTQVPQRVLAFTNRRHNRSRSRITALGRLVFVCVARPMYACPENAVVAGPEQALCDFIYLSRIEGISANGLVSFHNLDRLDMEVLGEHLSRYPSTVEKDVWLFLPSTVQRTRRRTTHSS